LNINELIYHAKGLSWLGNDRFDTDGLRQIKPAKGRDLAARLA